jgi:hypothetical protein
MISGLVVHLSKVDGHGLKNESLSLNGALRIVHLFELYQTIAAHFV